jgi:RNase P protein component
VRATFVPVGPVTPGVYPQVGYAIGKRCGNAVARNALRRRMREAARDAASTLPLGIYLLRLEPAAAARPPVQFSADVVQALHRAAGRAVPS